MLIQIIDDDTDDLELFSEAVQAADPTVKCHVSASCQKGILDLNRQSTLPDYIFMDVNMPVMNGKECLYYIKHHERLKHIPVIIFSTTSNGKEIDEFISLGALEFIVKPTSFQKLVEIIQHIFGGKSLPRGQ
jgi:CheY-like chemotaxis protein